MVLRITLVLVLVCHATVLRAGMILDGVSDSLYTSHATQFAAVGKVGNASGVLIAPNWVLTAGHVAPANFVVNGNTYTVAQMIKHPQFLANGSNVGYGFDIALIRLSSNVVGVTPIPIYRGTQELGAVLSMAGYGETGVGSNGVAANAGTFRAGTNRADAFENFANGPQGQIGAQNALIVADFDAPSSFDNTGKFNTLGSATPTELEYHLAIGDSGGGAMIQEEGQWYVAGIHSLVVSQRNWTGDPTDSSLNFGYGAVSGMTRVSSYQSFILGYTGVPEPTSLALVAIPLLGVALRGRIGCRRKRCAVSRDGLSLCD
jgi:hypothetical protein